MLRTQFCASSQAGIEIFQNYNLKQSYHILCIFWNCNFRNLSKL